MSFALAAILIFQYFNGTNLVNLAVIDGDVTEVQQAAARLVVSSGETWPAVEWRVRKEVKSSLVSPLEVLQ